MTFIFCKPVGTAAGNDSRRFMRCMLGVKRLPVMHLVVVASLLLGGCAARTKAYSGPEREMGEVGVVAPDSIEGFKTKYIAVLEINGLDEMQEWSGGSGLVHLLPGEYRFLVEFKQTTQATTIPIVDLVTAIQDMSAAARHEETNIAFPVKGGFVHRIHYDENEQMYSVTREPATETVPTTAFYSASDAVPCVHEPDQNTELWCALVVPTDEPLAVN